jgi:hypothetical protein
MTMDDDKMILKWIFKLINSRFVHTNTKKYRLSGLTEMEIEKKNLKHIEKHCSC